MSGWRQPDRWGMGLSLVCALHCLAVPLAFALIPSLHLALHSFRDPLRPVAVGLLHLQRFDLHLVVFALGFAIASLIVGWRRHRRLRAAAWLLPAMVSFAYGLFAPASGWLHAWTLALGGLFLVVAHAVNLNDRRRSANRPTGPGWLRTAAGGIASARARSRSARGCRADS